MKVSAARAAAFDILFKIETERAFSSILLPIYEENLTPPDRGLCHELVLGVLRRQMHLDRVAREFSNREIPDAAVKIALRLGIYQLICLDKIPAYSAINESVELVKRAKKTSAKGVVNAILRRAATEKIEQVYADDLDRISIETSHPRWLIERWAKAFGLKRVEQLAVANNSVPSIAFRATLKGRGTIHNEKFSRSAFVDNCFIAEHFDSDLLDLAKNGEIYFQDEASQMVAAVLDAPPGGRFLDVCAAPGGKCTAVAARAAGESGIPGVPVLVAGDINHQRVVFLRENCRRQGADSVYIVQYDASVDLPFAEASFDTVLVDAPCSGTGTIRHNPEIRYFLDMSDLEELPNTQLAILQNASKLVKPGGTLVYSTCSLELEENEGVCAKFLEHEDAFHTINPRVPEAFLTREGFARTFPDRDGMDGFFIAVFQRK